MRESIIAVLMALALSVPAAATQTEADVIGDLLERWASAELTEETSGALLEEAYEIHQDVTPGSPCHMYVDFAVTIILLADSAIRSDVFVGSHVADAIFGAMPGVAETCRIGL